MASRDYPRLSIEEFGKQLIESGDLDPVYIALYGMMSNGSFGNMAHLNRWLLAYSCTYHCGVSSYLSEFEGYAFFDKLELAARNVTPAPVGGRWPRSKERRHWRGAQAIASFNALVGRYRGAPEQFIVGLTAGNGGPLQFREVAARVRDHIGFGHWIAFKMADIIDRLGLRKVEFNFDDVVIYDDPMIAAEMLVKQRLGLPENSQVKRAAVKDVFDYLETFFADYAAPPIYDRSIGLAEVETILCKWKSHMHGHYAVHNDIREIREGIVAWANISETASLFLEAVPSLPEVEHAAA